MRSEFVICGETFKTQKALLDRCRSILHSVTIDSPLAPSDSAFMSRVLDLHESRDEKVGAGVDHIGVADDGWGKRCFEIVRVDGSRTDFSFIAAVTHPSIMADLLGALRTAVVTSILRFKRRAFEVQPLVQCAITGEWLEYHQCHVDHAPPHTFVELAREWTVSVGLDPKNAKILGFEDGGTHKSLADERLTADWVRFHDERATLRIVSVKANLCSPRKRSEGAPR